MKTFTTLFLFFLSISLISQNKETFTKNFQTNSGIYGTVQVSTQAITLGAPYADIQADEILVQGVRTSEGSFNSNELSEYGINFPYRCKNGYFYVSGNGSMLIEQETSRVSGNFTSGGSTHLGGNGLGKTNREVKFSEGVKRRHNEAVQAGFGSAWDKNGRVDEITVSGVASPEFGKITDAIRTYKKDKEKEEEIIRLQNNVNNTTDKKEKLRILKKMRNLTDETENIDNQIKQLENELNSNDSIETNENVEVETDNSANRNSVYKRTNQDSITEATKLEYQKRAEYYENKTKREQQANAASAEAAAGILAMFAVLGNIIYKDMGITSKKYLYSGNNIILNMDFGYSLSGAPISFASDRFITSFNSSERIEETTKGYPISLNFRIVPKAGYETENYGGFGFATGEIGISPLLNGSHLHYNFGARAFGGLANFKGFAEFQTGKRNYVTRSPNEDESGKGNTKIGYNNVKLGLKLSWYKNENYAFRNHILIGLVNEKITSLDNNSYRSRLTSKKNLIYGIEGIQGYIFEWSKDNHFKLFFEIYPKYPYTGQRGGPISEVLDTSEGGLLFNIGFIRTIGGFLKPK